MPEVVVVVLSRAAPGRVEDGLAAFAELAAVTHTEKGCLAFTLHREPADPDRIVLVERWATREALDAHLETPHLLAFRRGSQDIWAEPAAVLVLDPVSAGDPAKGLLSGG
jgi:quinol monooxygenase YgiN